MYQVSNTGQVRSLNYRRTGKKQIKKPHIDRDGYKRIGLYKEGKLKVYGIHRLVAQTFIPNPNNWPQINHIDENKNNNAVWNLEWCTAKYNTNYGTGIQRRQTHRNYKNCYKTGSQHQRAIKVRCIETGKEFGTIKEAAQWAGCNQQNIRQALINGYRAKGYHWERVG